MTYRVYIVDAPTLLDDLLEDSERVFHHCCAIIQRVFHTQWLSTLGEQIGHEQLRHPDDRPTLVEARARQRLRTCRAARAGAQDDMLHDHRRAPDRRNEAIRAYVAALPATQEAHAAA